MKISSSIFGFMVLLLAATNAQARCYFHWGSEQSNKEILSTLENGQFGEKSMAYFHEDYLPEKTHVAGAGLYLSDEFLTTINYGDDLLLVCDDSNESPPLYDMVSLKKLSDSEPARLSGLSPLLRYQVFQDFSSWYVMPRALKPKDAEFKFTRLRTVQGRQIFLNELRKRSKDWLLHTAAQISSVDHSDHRALPLLSSLVIADLKRRLGEQTLKEVIEFLSLANTIDLKPVISFFKALGFNYDISNRADMSHLATLLTQYGDAGVSVIAAVILNEKAHPEASILLRNIFEERCLQNLTGACITYAGMMRQNSVGVRGPLNAAVDKFFESDFESIERQIDAQTIATLTARMYKAALVSGWKEGLRLNKRLVDGMVHSQLKNRSKAQSVGVRLFALKELSSIYSAGYAELFVQYLNYAYPAERAAESIMQLAPQLMSLDKGHLKIFEGHFKKLLESITFSKKIECADLKCLQELVIDSCEEVGLLSYISRVILSFESGFFSSLGERERKISSYAYAVEMSNINNSSLFKHFYLNGIGAGTNSQLSEHEFYALLLSYSKAIQQPNIQRAQTCSATFGSAG